ncbi:MAG: Gfo/Idh/MocA family oxidoreductase [candidate division KSB1 bacterium]|nr:Gfo/Idh/MocA family oxidoreductase [candidate division KSB1 bacterium]
MATSHQITLLGTGLIGHFYTQSIHEMRGKDRIHHVCASTKESARAFAEQWEIPNATDDMKAAIQDPDTDMVIIGIPNHLHKEAALMCAQAGKAVLCTKPLGRTAAEAKDILDAVEKAGVFGGYLEDLAYTPKTLKSQESVKKGALGKILWVRSRETHPGPHSDWFWDLEKAGGGAIVDLGCHCIEIIRNYIGKDVRPVEVMCTADTKVHPIEAEDFAICLIRFENEAIGQFEVSWAFRGGMDLRDEVSGSAGTIWINHWLRTGFEMFTSGDSGGYVAEKAESDKGWLFPVGDEVHTLGYPNMFKDMFHAIETGETPMESFYDGYVVNAVIDACYKSAQTRAWEPVELQDWRGKTGADVDRESRPLIDGKYLLIKDEVMPDGRSKRILKDAETGELLQTYKEE